MDSTRLTIYVFLAVVLPLSLLSGCKESEHHANDLTDHCKKGPMHERLKWKAENFFADTGVISLCKAIEAKNLDEIDRLVKSGVDINAKGSGNMTPLLWAFPMGEDIFKKMLELGANPNVKLSDTVLLVSLGKGKSVMSASVELVGGHKRASLVYNQLFYDICMDDYLKIILMHGGDPNLEEMNGETPIFDANVAQSRLLLNAGADINHRNYSGDTPIICKATLHDVTILFLLESGADYRIPNKDGLDLILKLERDKLLRDSGQNNMPRSYNDWANTNDQPAFDWLTNEGVNWEAARKALESPETRKNLKDLPADYQHRPWLPQRPTLKKPDAKAEKP